MSKIESSAGKALYEQQETKLSQQSAAFIELLTKRGILGDSSIDDDRVRQAKKEKKKSMYHNPRRGCGLSYKQSDLRFQLLSG